MLRSITVVFFLSLVTAFFGCTPSPASPATVPSPARSPRIAKAVCLMNAAGCPCYEKPNPQSRVLTRIFHSEALLERLAPRSSGGDENGAPSGYQPISRYDGDTAWTPKGAFADSVCFYPEKDLRWQPSVIDREGAASRLDHAPLSLAVLFQGLEKFDSRESALKRLSEMKHQSLGRFWFTYYHLALEEHHPGTKVPVLSPQGKLLGRASREFLEQVQWEGSGIADDGTKYHYSGVPGRYGTHTEKWGMAAGGGYEVYPYRTIAVNFAGFCSRLYPTDLPRRENCRRGGVLGTAVFIPEVAQRQIKMDDGSIHDGWFCATDTGSPSYIREDRIDIFVGAHGGGNPYLPASRQWNRFFAAGLKNSVRWDWRLWRTENERFWCDLSRLPGPGETPDPAKHCLHDYHTTTPEKAVTLEAAFDTSGQPLRCRKGKEVTELLKKGR